MFYTSYGRDIIIVFYETFFMTVVYPKGFCH